MCACSPGTKNVAKYINRKVAKRNFVLDRAHTNGVPYLVHSGNPVLAKSQLSAVCKSVHDSGGHCAKKKLVSEITSRFHVGRYGQLVTRGVVDKLACEFCTLNKQLPPKKHTKSIRSWEIFQRVQIDAISIATSK